MALDTARKRGSTVLIALPFRQWLAVPDGSLAASDRAALVRFSEAVAFGAPAGGGLPPPAMLEPVAVAVVDGGGRSVATVDGGSRSVGVVDAGTRSVGVVDDGTRGVVLVAQ